MKNLNSEKGKKFGKRQAVRIGIDLGTSNLLVYVEGEGIIFNEPSVIAMEYETGDIIAVGFNAAEMIGRGHHGIRIVSPLNQGVVSDMDAANKLIIMALQKVENVNIDLETSTVLICCPSQVTQIERDSMIDLAKSLGVKDVFIEEEVKAGSIGAGLDIYSSDGSMVVDIGGGTTDIGVLSLGDIVVSDTIRIAGNYFDNEIINYLQYEHGILVGKRTAERVKKDVATLRESLNDPLTTYANGRDIVSGLPKHVVVKQEEIRDLLREPFESICNTILKVLQRTPAELSSDIIKKGIFLNGGGAMIDGIDEFITNRVFLDVHRSKNPMTAIA
ncbi:MAG: rod shape-determining protein, partial [Candidatus Izemoplasmatales bacterium]